MAAKHDLPGNTSKDENDTVSALIEIQKCRVPQQKMRWIVENLECLGRRQSRKRKLNTDESEKPERPYWFRKEVNGFTDSNFVALSYTWDASEYETQNPKPEGHLIERRDREDDWESSVRNSVLERVTRYMQCHDVPLLWIDRHSIPQKKCKTTPCVHGECKQKRHALDAMDWVYSLSDHPVALLGRPIQSEDEIATLSAILSGALVKYQDGKPALDKDTEYRQAKKMLDLLHEITRDKWWRRAWTFQENYKAGLKMTLLIHHDPDLERAKRSTPSGTKAMFGVVPGELSIQSVKFFESATEFCLAFRQHHFATSEDEEKIIHILKTAGRYRMLLSHSTSMSGIIISDVNWRGVTEPWDRLAIIANCCQYATRLDAARLQQMEGNVASLDLSILALRLLNGEILNNEEAHVPDGTIVERMNDLFFDDFRAPKGAKKLTYNKGCRFFDVEFTRTGIKTKGHLWKLGETLRPPRSSPRLSQTSHKDKKQLSEYERTRLKQLSELIRAKHTSDDAGIVDCIKDFLEEDSFVMDDQGSFSLRYRRLMTKAVVRAMDADQTLSLGYLCDPEGEPTVARGIFIHDRDAVESDEPLSQADKDPAYVFTSLWSDEDVDEEYLANELDHHVSIGVRLSDDRSQESLQLYTQEWVLGLCFFTGVPTSDVVFPWPQLKMMQHRMSIADRIKDTFKRAESDYPLHVSICNNDVSTLQEVLGSREASFLLLDGDGCWGTPLHVAVYLDNIEAANLILQVGVGVDVTADSSAHEHRLSPLALAVRLGNQRLLWRLWQHLHSQEEESKANVDSCLFEASINSQTTILRALLSWKEWTTKAKSEALFWAARSWKAYSAQLLTTQLSFPQDVLDKALHHAVDFGPLIGDDFKLDYNGDDYLQQQLLIALLIDAGANPNATDHRGKSALHFLGSPIALNRSGPVVRLNETAIRILLSHNSSVSLEDDVSGANPLHAAAFGSNLNMLQLYLSSCPSEQTSQALRSKNNFGETLLHYAAAGAKRDIVEFLLSQGLDVNGINTNGWTPLHCALTPARQGSQLNGFSKSTSEALEIAKILLLHGANPRAVTAEGWTPLHCLSLFASKKKENTELGQFVDNMIHRGVDIHARATFLFWNELGNVEPKYHYWGHEVQDRIQEPETSGAIVRFGYTPLHFSAAHGSISMAKASLDLGADPLSKDARGNTAIKIAANSLLLDDRPSTRNAIVKLLTEAAVT
ncbi:unnamed protein product [Fusarium graminearum]|nr:unnamed protein product [Fusarium graminearum]